MATAIATGPYSSSRTQPGTRQGWPNVCEYRTKKTFILVSVQIMSGRADADRRNGTSHSGSVNLGTGENGMHPDFLAIFTYLRPLVRAMAGDGEKLTTN